LGESAERRKELEAEIERIEQELESERDRDRKKKQSSAVSTTTCAIRMVPLVWCLTWAVLVSLSIISAAYGARLGNNAETWLEQWGVTVPSPRTTPFF
jgi:hypothetical protein